MTIIARTTASLLFILFLSFFAWTSYRHLYVQVFVSDQSNIMSSATGPPTYQDAT